MTNIEKNNSLPPGRRIADQQPKERVEEASVQALSEALRSSFVIIKVIMVILVLLFLGSGFFTVRTMEKAIILRFGKPVTEDESALLGPGAHFAFPKPIDEVVKIPLGEVQSVVTQEGWYYTTPAMEVAGNEPPPGKTLNPERDGYLITSDGGIVHIRGTLRYRIAEPGLRYTLDFDSASNHVKNAFDNALVYAALRSTIDITKDTTAFREIATARLNELVEKQKLGIIVEQVAVQVIPPRQLRADFDRVLEADVKRSTTINDARRYENETISKAKAEATAKINAAEAERKALVELVSADVRLFKSLLPEFKKNPQLFKELRYAEILNRIFTNSIERVVLQEREDGKPRELRILINREPEQPPTPEQKTAEHKH
ncbi:MAG: protease modulator HflK [Limisphaerales bacterium]|jgi:membrane protease subunit HflK